MNRFLLSILISVMTMLAYGQNEHKIVRQGNKQYDKGDYANAEAKYKKALEIDQKHEQASFNLGDAYFKQGRYDEAITQFTISANSTDDNVLKNKSYYNLGNANLEAFKSIDASSNQEEMQKKSQYLNNSIEAYKNALKINPADVDSKYNLSYALKLKKEGEGGDNQQKQDQEKQDKGEEKKDKQEKDKKDENKQDQDQKKENDKKDENAEKQPQPKPDDQKMDKQQADKLLEKQAENEKKVQAKVMKQKQKSVKVKIEKEW